MVLKTRRGFLQSMTGIGAASTGLIVGTGKVRGSTTVTGRLIAYDGDPIVGREISGIGVESRVYTNSDGKFSFETTADTNVKPALYKGDENTHLLPIQDGVPHVYQLQKIYSTGEDTDLGVIEIPKGHLVRLRAKDSEGNPVRNAIPGVRHGGYGIGSSYMATESDGWAYLKGADFDGIELAGSTLLSMEIPTDDPGAYKLEKRVQIDGPKTVTFQVDDGVTVSGDNSKTTAEPTTREPTTTKPTTTTQTAKETKKRTTTSQTTPPKSTKSTSQISTTSGQPPPQTTTESTRGFLTNGEQASDLKLLRDPFTLTVGGFALSVAGIAHQMIRGY